MLYTWQAEDPVRFVRAMVRVERRAVARANRLPFLSTVEGGVLLIALVLGVGMAALLWSNGWHW
jgi:hypothetical protein